MLLDEYIKTDQDRIEVINALLTEKRRQLRTFHGLVRGRADRYHLKHYKNKPEQGEEQITLPLELRRVDAARALLTMEPFGIRAYREFDQVEDREDADRLEAWLRGVHYRNCQRQRQDPVKMVAHDMLSKGMGVFVTYWDPNLDSRYDPATDQFDEGAPLLDVPIVIKRRDPLSIFPEESGEVHRWEWVMSVEKIPASRVQLLFPEAKLESVRGKRYDERLLTEVELVDIWSRERNPETGEWMICNTVMVDGKELVKPVTWMDRYSDLPFEIVICIETPEKAWERRCLPITYDMEKLVGELETLENSKLRSAKLFSQLPPVYKGEGLPPELDVGFGEVQHIRPGDEFGFMRWPGNPPDMYRMSSFIERQIEAGGFGAPISEGAGASTSGYALQLRGEAGTLRMVAPAESLSLALKSVLQQVCSLAANYAPDHPMTVVAQPREEREKEVLALRGGECEGFYIDVSIAARFPEDKARDRAMGMQLAVAPRPILDMRTILEDFMHIENAAQVKERILEEQAEMDPMVRNILIGMAMQKSGMWEWIQQWQALQQPPPQQPGVPSMPAQPTMGTPAQGVPTQVASQLEMGAIPSQAAGIGPKEQLFPEEEAIGAPFPTTA